MTRTIQTVICGRTVRLERRMSDLLAAGTAVALVIGGFGAQDLDGIEVLAPIRPIGPIGPIGPRASQLSTVRSGDTDLRPGGLR
jgi:hypothetical protein